MTAFNRLSETEISPVRATLALHEHTCIYTLLNQDDPGIKNLKIPLVLEQRLNYPSAGGPYGGPFMYSFKHTLLISKQVTSKELIQMEGSTVSKEGEAKVQATRL